VHVTKVYDVRENFHLDLPLEFCEAYTDWLRAHGIDPCQTYRTEHHVIDVPLVRVYAYALDEQGRRYVDQAARDIARREPYDVLIRTTPPSPEDYE
jgi:hypothetical protein